MKTLEQVTDILRKSKAFSGRVPASAKDAASLVEIFRALIPANVASLQPDMIDGVENYEWLLAQLAAISNGELAPDDVQIKASRNGKLSLTFTQQAVTHTLKFEHAHGNYIDQRFLDALQTHCKKKLPGTFLFFADAETIEAVYLPVKAFKRVHKEILSQQSTDALAAQVQAGSAFGIRWESIAHEVVNGLTKEGETVATALLKAKFPETLNSWGVPRRQGILEMLQGMVNVFRENAHGETPTDIAQAKGWDHLLPELAGRTLKTVPVTTLRDGSLHEHYHYTDDFKAVFDRLDAKGVLDALHFDVTHAFLRIHLAVQANFTEGENDLCITRYRYGESDIGYDVFSQKRGANGWSISQFVPQGDVDQLCELVERYSRQSFA